MEARRREEGKECGEEEEKEEGEGWCTSIADKEGVLHMRLKIRYTQTFL